MTQIHTASSTRRIPGVFLGLATVLIASFTSLGVVVGRQIGMDDAREQMCEPGGWGSEICVIQVDKANCPCTVIEGSEGQFIIVRTTAQE